MGHLVAACCFLVLAGLRAADGAWAWAAVFALAALAQGLLGARLRRRPSTVTPHPPQASTWRVLTASSCVLGAVLLFVQPALGLVAAAVAVYCLRATRSASAAG
jgi:hypothetical protein